MRKFALFLVFVVMAFFLVAQERQTKLAVMEIEDQSGKLSKKLLEGAAEALRTELVASNRFTIISKDRQRQAMIKGEKKESWKECYDQSCRIQLGQALTADQILTGIVTYFGKRYTLTAELVDLAKEATVKGAKAEFDGTEEGLAEAIRNIAAQIAGVKRGGSSFQSGKTGEKVEEWDVGQGEETIVKFDSTPGEAVVMVDGRILCQKTPCSKMLTQGRHEVTLQKENYLPKTKVFDIKKGQNISAELEPDFGWLEVTANYKGIDIVLDGKNIGETPIAKRELNPGAHQLDSSHNCFYQTGEKFVLKRGETKTIRLDLKEKESGIKVTAQDKEGNDLEADILVDGKNIGTAPGTYKVPLCSKELVVKSKAGQYKQALDLAEKKVAQIKAVLKKSGAGSYDIKDDVVVDEKTGLMWQRERAGNTMNHAAAIEYCGDLSLGGYSDWRLPSISELKTLIVGCQSGTDACKVSDNCLSSNCWSRDTCFCEGNKGPGEDGYYWQKGVWQGGGAWFWSSSVLSDGSSYAWSVPFGDGNVYSNSRSIYVLYVRCVRGRP